MVSFKKFCENNNIKLETMSNFDINDVVKKLNIPNFRGVFMRDNLPKKINARECGIVNLQSESEPGSHWAAYFKSGKSKYYFDSYGLNPTNELLKYLKTNGCFSTFEIQPMGTVICGQLCIYVLYRLSQGDNFVDILLDLRDEFLI